MATPVGPAGTATPVVNIPAAERRPAPEPVEETRPTEPERSVRRENQDPDSNTGNNIDTTA